MKGVASLALMASMSAVGCAKAPAAGEGAAPARSVASAVPAVPEAPRAVRAPLDGRSFPDKVLALTWDDGPDDGTLELARYLRAQHVVGTFFVVGAWIEGLSDEPGRGRHVLETGHEHLHVLGDLVALGHRLGNHTHNHVILRDAPPDVVRAQLRDNQAAIDRFVTGDLRFFRAPGGAWSPAASAAVDGDPALARLVGPMHWDIDGKDWEGSLYCREGRPAVECERAAPGGELRVKASVTARRYLSIVDAVGHGIVLLHDRVGHVGSDYALQVAKGIVPQLEARGYVFAPPVLRFSPLAARDPGAPPTGGDVRLADVNGDGRADRCERRPEGMFCALAGPTGELGEARKWSTGADFGDGDGWAGEGYRETIRLGDINGDGRADVCGRSRDGLVCALSNGRSFLKATVWLAEMSDAAGWLPYGASLQLVDVNGDGRADVCARGAEGGVSALSP